MLLGLTGGSGACQAARSRRDAGGRGAVVAGYESHLWFEFAVAIVGAAAVLSGLLFVAMSINIERIMGIVTLPTRAAGTLVLFVVPLLIGLWILIPEQSSTMLGVEVVATGLLGGGLLLRLNSKRAEQETWGAWLLGSYVPSVMVALLTVLGGITLIAERGGGLYLVAPAVVIALLTGLTGAWVLLVEILR
jgi:hypothetical protein